MSLQQDLNELARLLENELTTKKTPLPYRTNKIKNRLKTVNKKQKLIGNFPVRQDNVRSSGYNIKNTSENSNVQSDLDFESNSENEPTEIVISCKRKKNVNNRNTPLNKPYINKDKKVSNTFSYKETCDGVQSKRSISADPVLVNTKNSQLYSMPSTLKKSGFKSKKSPTKPLEDCNKLNCEINSQESDQSKHLLYESVKEKNKFLENSVQELTDRIDAAEQKFTCQLNALTGRHELEINTITDKEFVHTEQDWQTKHESFLTHFETPESQLNSLRLENAPPSSVKKVDEICESHTCYAMCKQNLIQTIEDKKRMKIKMITSCEKMRTIICELKQTKKQLCVIKSDLSSHNAKFVSEMISINESINTTVNRFQSRINFEKKALNSENMTNQLKYQKLLKQFEAHMCARNDYESKNRLLAVETMEPFLKKLIESVNQVCNLQAKFLREIEEKTCLEKSELLKELKQTRNRLSLAFIDESRARLYCAVIRNVCLQKLTKMKAVYEQKLSKIKFENDEIIKKDCVQCAAEYKIEQEKHAKQIQELWQQMNTKVCSIEDDYKQRLSNAISTISDLQSKSEIADIEANQEIKILNSKLNEMRLKYEDELKRMKVHNKSSVMRLRELLKKEQLVDRTNREQLRQKEIVGLEGENERQNNEEQGMVKFLPIDVQHHLQGTIDCLRAQVNVLKSRSQILEEDNNKLRCQLENKIGWDEKVQFTPSKLYERRVGCQNITSMGDIAGQLLPH